MYPWRLLQLDIGSAMYVGIDGLILMPSNRIVAVIQSAAAANSIVGVKRDRKRR